MIHQMTRYVQAIMTPFLLLLLCESTVGQEQRQQIPPTFENALSLYNQSFFTLARNQFQLLEQSLPNDRSLPKAAVSGYIILCNIALSNNGLEDEVEVYTKEYPSSTLIQEIWFRLANYFFVNEQYESALLYYEKCSFAHFGTEQRAELAYKAGYSAFQIKNFTIATPRLSRVLQEKEDTYDIPAIYYLAYIDYLNNDFYKAVEGFSKIAGDIRFARATPYYILQSRFLLKQYEQVISEGEALYLRSEGEERLTIARILAESSFKLNRLHQAREYFEAYQKNASILSRQDNYLAGMINYAQKNFSLSIPFFEQAAALEDSLGQNALYYLGEAYVQTKNKLLALDAFRSSSSLDFDPAITEDAFFNYAKLSFDVNSSIASFNAYMERYPNTKKSNEIQSYIADAYLLNHDYRSALTALQAIREPGRSTLEKLQRASFLRAMQLFNAGSYREAEQLFNQAINSKGQLSGVTLLATYWKAEALFRSNRFEESIAMWNQFLSSQPTSLAQVERRTALYNIAYACFRLEKFSQAEQYFKNYLSGGNPQTLSYFIEAQNRLGDCAFLSREYEKAIAYYASAFEANGLLSDYSLYQTALAQGLLFQQSRKISTLQQLI